MQRIFTLQKKCIRIVCNKTAKVDGHFQHTKPLFFKLKLLTLFNLYNYFCGCFGMNIIRNKLPAQIFDRFLISTSTNRLILPKFRTTRMKNSSFVLNVSKILNYLYINDIPYHILSPYVFKKRLKTHLLTVQNISLDGDPNWLPCNHDLFSYVTINY